ncbi:MBL fold metallo-hydrolase [bacterium]|nr:MBL fold metallo-hydrolase [bacterium]
MKFTLTGSGTSQGVPVIGCSCQICQSIDPKDKRLRASGILETDNTTLVFDTGPDFRQQMLRAQVKSLDAVVFTHQHKDHVAGLDDVRPFNFLQRRNMDIYASEDVLIQLKKEFSYIFDDDAYPGIPKLTLHQIGIAPFQIGDIELTPIPVMHGKMPVLGFRAGSFAYLTDVNFISPSSMELLKGVDYLVLDALRQAKHHSHFSLNEAIDIALEIGAKRTFFTHISHLMGKTEDVTPSLPINIELGYDGLVLEM